MLHEDSCMYLCMYVSNATGVQLLQTCFLWVWHCLHMCMQWRRACTMMESPAQRRQQLGTLRTQQHKSSCSKEKREHQWEIHW